MRSIPSYRIFDAVNVLLSMQNSDGGFASYEKRRGPTFLEYLNPSEVFGEIMVDYSYTECSSAVVQALTQFSRTFPDHRSAEISKCIKKAVSYIRSQQKSDGSWFGSWAICFTYATWFGIEALACIGENYTNSKTVKKACDFLISKQNPDGGWGESLNACYEKKWVQYKDNYSLVVHTSWACLALMAAKCEHREAIEKGIKLIMLRQKLNGEWKHEAIEGVFNKTCMISYPNYKFIFTIWALARYAEMYEK